MLFPMDNGTCKKVSIYLNYIVVAEVLTEVFECVELWLTAGSSMVQSSCVSVLYIIY